MKNYIILNQLIIFILISFTGQNVIAQHSKKWNIGVQVGYGKDYYQRKLKGLASVPGATGNFESKSSVELGVYGERFVGRRFSVFSKIYYSSQNVPSNTLCNCSHLDYLQKERHHMASLGLGVRGYLLYRSAVKVFLGAGMYTDYFIGYTEKRNDDTDFHWNARAYNRINPGISGELGLQWKRIGLSGEYKSSIGNTFAQGYNLSTGGEVKRSISRQGYVVKLSVLLTKPDPR